MQLSKNYKNINVNLCSTCAVLENKIVYSYVPNISSPMSEFKQINRQHYKQFSRFQLIYSHVSK
jgi:hypothetical protein